MMMITTHVQRLYSPLYMLIFSICLWPHYTYGKETDHAHHNHGAMLSTHTEQTHVPAISSISEVTNTPDVNGATVEVNAMEATSEIKVTSSTNADDHQHHDHQHHQPTSPMSSVDLRNPDYSAGRMPSSEFGGHEMSQTTYSVELRQLGVMGLFNSSVDHAVELDVKAWLGNDQNRMVLEVESERQREFSELDASLMWQKPMTPFWNIQAGGLMKLHDANNMMFVGLGIEGLAPYWIHTQGVIWINDQMIVAKLHGTVDYALSQGVTLQPNFSLTMSTADVEDVNLRQGLSSWQLGTRLLYRPNKRSGVYVGIQRQESPSQDRTWLHAGLTALF